MIKFTRLTLGDIPKLYHWLQEPHVDEYWNTEHIENYGLIYQKYYLRLLEGKIDMFFIQYFDVNIGFIQLHSDYNKAIYGDLGSAKGIDLFIGEKDYIHKGIGSICISKFLFYVSELYPEVEYVCIDPESKNKVAIRAYEKSGFHHIKTSIDPNTHLETYYMLHHIT